MCEWSSWRATSDSIRRSWRDSSSRKGDIVVTLDADLQNPPEEIPRLVRPSMRATTWSADGARSARIDAFRRIASRYHNKLTSAIVGVPMHDYGCMLRAYRRHIVDAVVAVRREGGLRSRAGQFIRQTRRRNSGRPCRARRRQIPNTTCCVSRR